MSVKPTKAMVLAAGLGVRMRPLTDKMPKPLVRVAGSALLDHVLDKLGEAGVSEAVVNVHYLPDQIIDHTKGRTRPRVIISDERDQVLGTGGAVVKALPLLGNAPFFHVNADTMWIDGVRPESGAAGGNLRSRADGHPAVDGTDDEQHRLWRPRRLLHAARRRAAQAPGTPGGSVRLCGCRDHVAVAVRRCAHRRILADEMFDRANEQERLFGLRLDGVWMHVGTPDAVQAAERRFSPAWRNPSSFRGARRARTRNVSPAQFDATRNDGSRTCTSMPTLRPCHDAT